MQSVVRFLQARFFKKKIIPLIYNCYKFEKVYLKKLKVFNEFDWLNLKIISIE